MAATYFEPVEERPYIAYIARLVCKVTQVSVETVRLIRELVAQ